jgi:hypothetical protein
LQDGQLIPVASVFVFGGERVGQDRKPLAQQRFDVFRSETVTDPLQDLHVVHRGEPVVQGLKADPCLGCLAFSPLITVHAQLGGIGKIGTELEEERAEVGVHAIKIEEIDERRGANQPGIAAPGHRVVAPLGAPHPCLLLSPADEQHPLIVSEVGEELLSEIVLTLTLGEADQLQATRGDETVDVGDERLGHRIHQRRGRVVVTAVADEKALDPTTVGQPRLPHVEVHPVDGLHLEHHMISKDISDTAR